MLDTGFAPCYTRYKMVQWIGEPLDLNVGDIVIEKQKNHAIGDCPIIKYWVISKVIINDNPIRYGHTYDKHYSAFNLENEMQRIDKAIFRSQENWQYEVIRG